MNARKACAHQEQRREAYQPVCGRGLAYTSPCLAEAMCFVTPGAKEVVMGVNVGAGRVAGAGSVEETAWTAMSGKANCAGGGGRDDELSSLKFLDWAREAEGAAS